jgi:hypothetical protein
MTRSPAKRLFQAREAQKKPETRRQGTLSESTQLTQRGGFLARNGRAINAAQETPAEDAGRA